MGNYTYESRFLTKVFETPEVRSANWFGYYNYDVLSQDKSKMLCNRADFDGRALSADDTIELGYYDLPTGEWHYIDTTDSFNWQQGAMLQWVPGSDEWVAYNISDKKDYRAVLYNIVTREKKNIDFPIYGLTPDGKYSISLDYKRSYWCRAYHYQPIADSAYDVRVAEEDGIFRVNLENNTVERIIAIEDIIATDSTNDFKDAKHWLEHIMISPEGKRIAFLHRFSYGTGYNTRLVLSDIDGKNIQVISGWKNFDWSHFGWNGDDAFAIYTVKRSDIVAAYAKNMQKKSGMKRNVISFAHKILKTIIPKKAINRMKGSASYYQYYSFNGKEFVLERNFDIPLFDIDGHPSFVQGVNQYMITDSYPDAEQYQRLIAYNTKSEKGILLGRFFAYYKGNPASCDLHPKLSRDGEYLAVDTAFSRWHKMLLFKINWDEIKKEI